MKEIDISDFECTIDKSKLKDRTVYLIFWKSNENKYYLAVNRIYFSIYMARKKVTFYKKFIKDRQNFHIYMGDYPTFSIPENYFVEPSKVLEKKIPYCYCRQFGPYMRTGFKKVFMGDPYYNMEAVYIENTSSYCNDNMWSPFCLDEKSKLIESLRDIDE